MRQDMEILIDNLLYKMKECGVEAKVTYCLSESGELLSFEIKIVGYLA